MARFRFRLQKVLEYRSMLEQEAKDRYLNARSRTIEAEAELANMTKSKLNTLKQPLLTLGDRLALDLYMIRCEDKEAEQRLVIQACENDEETLRLAWIQSKKDLESIVKLKDHALVEWTEDENRKEQAGLDEWAVLHRRSA